MRILNNVKLIFNFQIINLELLIIVTKQKI